MRFFLPRMVPVVTSACMLLVSACTEGDACFQGTCALGFRCVQEDPRERGHCEACDSSETPYDGVDNDCDPSTRDFDLDSDGDNAKSAGVQPGGDCDDQDPTVSSTKSEICGDGKDNNCNGAIDEPECGDTAVPTVTFLTNVDALGLKGTVLIRVSAEDDIQVKEVTLFRGTVSIGQMTMAGGAYELNVDTTALPEGALSLRAVATDLTGKTGDASVDTFVDNATPPTVQVSTPEPDGSYGGVMSILATAEDDAGVAQVEFLIDGDSLATLVVPPFSFERDTLGLSEGQHTFVARATDNNGHTGEVSMGFVVDRTAPEFTINLTEGQTVSGTVAVSMEATDASGILRVEAHGHTASTSTLSFVLDTRVLVNGPFVLRPTAIDKAIVDGQPTGNRTQGEINLTVQNAVNFLPSVSFTTPAAGDGVYRVTQLLANASSPAGVRRVDFWVDGSKHAEDEEAPYAATFDFSDKSGQLDVSAVVLDMAGLTATVTQTVTVVGPPQLRLALERSLPSGHASTPFEVADMTGDGIQDLVVAGSGVSVLPGTGEKFRFGNEDVVTEKTALEVRAVDLDGQDPLDLVVLYPNDVECFVRESSGFWRVWASFSFDRVASTFEVADLDNDGDLDVVLGHAEEGTADIMVSLQTDPGTFASPVNYGLVGKVEDLAVANLDGVGDLDVVVVGTKRNTFTTVYLNGGGATFGAGIDHEVFQDASRVKVGELTGDDVLDIVVIGTWGLSILEGKAANPGKSYERAWVDHLVDVAQGLALGDVNEDGLLDIVMGFPKRNGIEVRTNQGGPFGNATFGEETRSYAMLRDNVEPRIADLDGDGLFDIASLGPGNQALAVAPNRGKDSDPWRFGAAPIFPVDFIEANRKCRYGPEVPVRAPGTVAVGQVIGDANQEIVFGVDLFECNERPKELPDTEPEGGEPIFPAMVVIRNSGNGNIAPEPQIDLPPELSPTEIAIGDLDGMNGIDLAAGSAGQSGTEGLNVGDVTGIVLLEDGAGGYTNWTVQYDNPSSVAIGDVDNDGQGEVLFTVRNQDPSVEGVVVFDADGTENFSSFVGQGASSITLGNLDEDASGFTDFAIANSGSNNVTVHTWSGAAFNTTTYNTNGSISALATVRLGGEPRIDLVGVGKSGVILLEGHSVFGFGSPTPWPAGTPSEPFRVASGDFNRDGLPDVLVLNAEVDAFVLLIARPQGGFFAPDVISVSRSPRDFTMGRVWVSDTDVVVVNDESPGVLFLLNETPAPTL